MRALELAMWFYVGTIIGRYAFVLRHGDHKAAFMATSLMVRRHVATVCLYVTLPLLAIAEWLLVTTNEGDQING